MMFHLPKPVVPLLFIAMGAMVLSAAAQPSGKSIIFSAPPADDAESATPTLAPPSSPMPSLPSTLQAPVSPFNYNSAPDNFPMPPQPSANSSEQQQMKKLLDDRKNWTLMTPEEIFGTATTDKSSQPAERDVTGQEKTPTQLERYLDRQNQPPTDHTNNWQNDRDNAPWELTPGRDRANLSDSRHDGTTDMSQNLNRLFGGLRNNDILANQNANAGWDSLNPPAPQMPVKPDPEQLAAMERFRQLLAPSPAPTPEPSPNSSFFPAPKPVVDPNFTQPDFVPNPAGASFTPLTTGIGRPTGLTPLPGIISPVPHPAAAPSWAPQPPPWLSQTPQPFAAPQWKF